MELIKIILAKLFSHQFSSHKHRRENNLDKTEKNISSLAPQGFRTNIQVFISNISSTHKHLSVGKNWM